MRRGGCVTALTIAALLSVGLFGGSAVHAGPLPLPPPPSLPPTTPPAALKPFLEVAGPTVGAVCGTASLVALLAPSLAEGYFHIPFESLIDRHTFADYANTALYVCGFIPFPLTPTACQTDLQIVDVLRGLNPLVAQLAGLYPEGATIDTLAALEPLLPSGPTVAGPVVADLSRLMDCSRASGAPPVTPHHPSTANPVAPKPVATAPAASAITPPPAPPTGSALPPGGVAGGTPDVTTSPPDARSPAPPVAIGAPPRIFATRFTSRHGRQWLGVALGVLLLLSSLAGWLWSRRSPMVAT